MINMFQQNLAWSDEHWQNIQNDKSTNFIKLPGRIAAWDWFCESAPAGIDHHLPQLPELQIERFRPGQETQRIWMLHCYTWLSLKMGYHQFHWIIQWYPMDHRQTNMARGRTTSSDLKKWTKTTLHRIGWWENLQEPLYLMVKTMVSCRFSLKPIHWTLHEPKRLCLARHVHTSQAAPAARRRYRSRVARHLRHGPTTMSPCRTMMVSQSWVHLWMKEPWQWGLSGEVTMYIYIYIYIYLFIYYLYLYVYLFIYAFIY